MFPTLLAEIEKIVPDKCNILQESYNSFKVKSVIVISIQFVSSIYTCKLEGL